MPKRANKSRRIELLIVCLLATVLGGSTMALGDGPSTGSDTPASSLDAIWIADACHMPINTTGSTPPRTYAECCGAKCGEWNTGLALDGCIAGCLLLA